MPKRKPPQPQVDHAANMRHSHRAWAIRCAVHGWLQDVSLDDAIALWYDAQGAREQEAQRQQEAAQRRKEVRAAMRAKLTQPT